MTVPHIPELPPMPSRRRPETFSDEGDAAMAALPAFRDAANALAGFVEERAAAAETSAIETAAGVVATAADRAAVAVDRAAVAGYLVDTSAAAGNATAAASVATDAAGAAAASADASAASAAASANNVAAAGVFAALAADWADSDGEVEPGRRSAKWWAEQATEVVTGGVIDDGEPRADRAWSSQRVQAEISDALAGIDTSGKADLTGATFSGPVLFNQELDLGNSGTSKEIDWSLAHNQRMTLNANCVLTFTAPAGVFRGGLKVVKDATATSRSMTWPAGTRFLGNIAPEAPTGSEGVAMYSVYWDGATWWVSGGRF